MAAGPSIVADTHEEQSRIPEFLADLGATVEVTTLPAGDYAVGEDTIVERKRVLDLHGAVVKGRIWAQIGKLRSAADYPYLLIEGTDLDRGPIHPNAIRGICLAVIDLGVALLQSDHQRDSARWLHRLAVRCQRVERPPDRPIYAQRPKATLGDPTSEAVLSAVPGISSTTARALLERFGSVSAVIRAEPEAWLEVPGVGPERARLLAEALSHQWSLRP